MKKIYFIVPYPIDEAPSQRFRFEQYLPVLSQHEMEYLIKPFLGKKDWRTIYSRGNYFKKFQLLASGLLKRIGLLFFLRPADFIFIHREAAPFGPPVLEWIIAKVLKKKIIYDFDDAIWQTDKVNESFSERLVRWRSKVGSICKWSYRISCGNDYLCSYAMQFNRHVIRNPTTIDTHLVHNRELHPIQKDQSRTIIGWTGSHSTLKYFAQIKDVLSTVTNAFPQVDIVVIADKDPELDIPRLNFRPWSKVTEIADLMALDIGIMPLPNDPWSKGKCGFKALQYMALEIPAVISPVGVNTEIIQNGINGYLCEGAEDWINVLANLVNNQELRRKIGKAGKKTVTDRYSVDANCELFLSLFQ